MREVASRYRRFPLLLMPAGVVNTAGLYLPVLLVAATYGATAAGWLGFTQRVLALPVTLIGQATAQVYLSELARNHRERSGRQGPLFRVASARLALVGGVLGILLLLLAAPLFPVVFGEAWRTSGLMAQALAISLALQLVASPLSQTLIVFERTGTQLAWDVTRLVTVSTSVYLSSALGLDVTQAIWVLSITSAACYAVLWLLSQRTLRYHA